MRCRDGRALHRQLSRPIQRLARRGTEPPWQALFDYWKLPCMLPTLDRSCDFYKRVLGLGPDVGTTAEKENQKGFRPLQIPGGQVLLLFPKGSATTTAVLPGGTIPPHDGNGRLHLAFAISAAEVDAWRERLQSHGVSIEGEMEWPRGGTSLYFRDPDGHLVELATPGLWSIY